MVMTVECPSCGSSFPVDPAKVPEGGVNARCSSCATVFRVERPSPGRETGQSPPLGIGGPEEGGQPRRSASAPPHGAAAADDAYGDADPTSLEARDVDASTEAPGPRRPEADDSESDLSVPTGFEGFGQAGSPGAEAPGDAPYDGGDLPSAAADDWVFETEESVDPDSLDIHPVGTVEETVSDAAQGSSDFFRRDRAAADEGAAANEGAASDPDAPSAATEDSPSFEMEPQIDAVGSAAGSEGPTDDLPGLDAAAPAEPQGTEGVAAPESAKPVKAFSFGDRDPADKARRLARVLVSDMIMYNPERHERALANDSLRDDFEEEIAKSWKEYVEQVGSDMAESTDFWTQALNDVLAKGRAVF